MKRTQLLSTALALCLGSLTAAAEDTNILAWGWASDSSLVTNVPPLGTNAIALAGSDAHCLALLADRTVLAWGDNSYAKTNVPPDATNAVGIAAGADRSLAVRGDGAVSLWGLFGSGSKIPPEATNVVAVGVGPGAPHAVVLRKDGSVVDWGSSLTTNIPPAAFNIVSVAAGFVHTIALRSDGKVIAWGYNSSGQINVPASATNIVAIAAGWHGGMAVRADGTLVKWGNISSPPSSATNVVELACCGAGYSMSDSALVLKSDGTVAGWGAQTFAATNIMAIAASSLGALAAKAAGPPIIPLPAVRRTVASSQTAYLRLRAVGALPLSHQWSFQGTNLPGATNAVLVVTNALPASAGFYSLVASNALGVITNSDMELVVVPIIITNQPASQAVYVGASPTLSVGVLGQSPSYQWSFKGTNIAWGTNSSLTLTNSQLTNAGTYSVGVSNTYGGVISSDAVLSVWPILVTQPPQDQVIFRGGTTAFSITAQASSPLTYQWQRAGTNLLGATSSMLILSNALYEQAGAYSVITSTTNAAVTNSARLSIVPVAAWGNDSYGQTNLPPNVTNVIAVASGEYHGLALEDGGAVAAWGRNSYGQTNVPAGLTNVVTVAAGDLHSLVLGGDGTLMAWGDNSYGKTNVPGGLANIVACAGGGQHTLALQVDGTVSAWGDNNYDQINVPAGLTDVVAIAAGYRHNLALTAVGSVVAWGLNDVGQTNVPAGLTNVVAIAAGHSHSLALKADCTIVVWGGNSLGQTNVPAGVGNVVAIASGRFHSLALNADGEVAAWGDPTFGATNVPTGLTNVVAIAAGYGHSYALVGSGPPVVNGLPVNPVCSNHVFSVSLVSQNNRVYRLEHKGNLSDCAWVAHPLVAGTGGALTFTDPAATGTQRFYRVRRW